MITIYFKRIEQDTKQYSITGQDRIGQNKINKNAKNQATGLLSLC